jgi:hypothetical protein
MLDAFRQLYWVGTISAGDVRSWPISAHHKGLQSNAAARLGVLSVLPEQGANVVISLFNSPLAVEGSHCSLL